MMKWLNVESFVLVTNGEMVIWYDDLNTVCKYGLVVANFVPQDIINLRVGVNCFFGLNSPPGNCLKRNFLGQPPGKFVPEDNTWKTTGKKFVQGDVLG